MTTKLVIEQVSKEMAIVQLKPYKYQSSPSPYSFHSSLPIPFPPPPPAAAPISQTLMVEEDLTEKNNQYLLRITEMNTYNSCSSNSMSKKRERLETEDNTNNKKPVNISTKAKRLNAHIYKKMFQIAAQKIKEEISQEDDHIAASDSPNTVNEIETPVMKSCSDSKHEKHRVALDSKEVGFDNPESTNETSQMDADECDTVINLEGLCEFCRTSGELLSCCGQGCEKRFHQSCLIPPLPDAFSGSWHCDTCTKNTTSESVELSKFQFEVSREVHDHVLPYVNKLRDNWHKGQNAVFFDGHDRLLKVVFFILSILDKAKQPILIITPSSALSLWETEFNKWSKSTNVVTYKETPIKSPEFYSENGCIKFQVLLSSPDVILEDFEMLDHIKWELIVIDESQRPVISKIFRKIKMIATDMKLLTVTSELMDVRQSYQNILSMLDSKYEDADVETNTLKEKLSPFVAFECKFNALKIQEYWVPVHLSHMQIEQYCSLLNSNFEMLTSSIRNCSSLHDILTQTQKCCDHPYLVDPNLRKSLKTNALIDRLGAEIEASGKLQLLDKLLLEIKRRGLRVLVLFQSVVSSEKITIGDILDDLVDRRFGEDSYVRIQAKILSKSKRNEALNMFNNIDSEMFVCLMDYHDCQPTMRLSSVDVVILFNSDWNPSNDLKALHRITIDSHCNRLRIFRLYSSFTIEEKSLILAKQGTILDRINYSNCHRLLAWGASYLFNKFSSSESKSKSKSKSNIDDLVHELSSLLLNKTENTDGLKSLNVSKALIHDGSYSENILLMGETEEHMKEICSIEDYLIENGSPNVFWSNLFKETKHIRTRGKSSSRLPRRVKLSFRHPYYSFGRYETENESDMENFEKDAITSYLVTTKLRSKRKVRKRTGARGHVQKESRSSNLTELTEVPLTLISDLVPLSTNNIAESTNIQTPQPQHSSNTSLETELENIKKEKEQVAKLHQEKKSMLVSECEKELSEIRKKYDALINESETCLTKKTKVLEDYYNLVYANKLLAETLWDAYNEEKTQKVKIRDIPASALVQSENRCTTIIPAGPHLRGPAPHLRPSLLASFNKLPTIPMLGSNYRTC